MNNINLDSAKDTLCKNILIYGYCKFENKGCAFNHNKSPPQLNPQQPTPVNDAAKRKFNLNTPSFQPGTSPAKFSPKLKDVSMFVPEDEKKKFNVSTPSFTPQNNLFAPPTSGTPPPAVATPTPGSPNPYTMGGEMYFGVPHGGSGSYPLQYHLYAPAPPPRLHMHLPQYECTTSTMFIPNDLREQLQKNNEATLQTIPRSTLPEHVHVYHSLVPIDRTYDPASKTWKVPSTVYKAFSNVDGNAYALRRIDPGFDIVDDQPLKFVKQWKTVRSANVVHVHDAFTTLAFGGSSSQLIVVYDYYPNSQTLNDFHKKSIGRTEPITEEVLWQYLIQLINGLQTIHDRGLAARSAMDISKIIVTSKNRVRIGGTAVSDILAASPDSEAEITSKDTIAKLQREDVDRLGQVLLDLCTLTLPQAVRHNQRQELLQLVQTSSSCHFSPEFLSVLGLLNDTDAEFDMSQFCQQYLTKRMFSTINDLEDSRDYMEARLSSEIENARLFRLMAKLNFVIDRPEQKDWSENGPKYIVKLFRDYIFFQYDEFGKPVVDLARVLTNLNKLDAGIEEKFLLVSRDEKNCIIVSYKEIRDTIDSLFRNLTRD